MPIDLQSALELKVLVALQCYADRVGNLCGGCRSYVIGWGILLRMCPEMAWASRRVTLRSSPAERQVHADYDEDQGDGSDDSRVQRGSLLACFGVLINLTDGASISDLGPF
jgi:hypothetical protein